MDSVATAPRIGPLDGRHAGTPVAAALPAAPAIRVALRASEGSIHAVEGALGVPLSGPIGTSGTAGIRSALRLGPDEWLVIEEGDRHPMADLAGVGAIHSAVDVSHRNAAILVTGPRASEALEAGVPRDLSPEGFPVGACARTILGKSEIVLWRGKEDAFRVEVWRSFAPYAMDFLAEACRDASL